MPEASHFYRDRYGILRTSNFTDSTITLWPMLTVWIPLVISYLESICTLFETWNMCGNLRWGKTFSEIQNNISPLRARLTATPSDCPEVGYQLTDPQSCLYGVGYPRQAGHRLCLLSRFSILCIAVISSTAAIRSSVHSWMSSALVSSSTRREASWTGCNIHV